MNNIKKYNNHLNTVPVQYLKCMFVSGCQMVRYSNEGLKTRLKKSVFGLKCPVFKWSAKSHYLPF